MTPEALRERLPDYALGLLDEGEAAEVAKFLRGDAAARAEARLYFQAAEALALGAPPVPPLPGEDMARIRAFVHAEGAGEAVRVMVEEATAEAEAAAAANNGRRGLFRRRPRRRDDADAPVPDSAGVDGPGADGDTPHTVVRGRREITLSAMKSGIADAALSTPGDGTAPVAYGPNDDRQTAVEPPPGDDSAPGATPVPDARDSVTATPATAGVGDTPLDLPPADGHPAEGLADEATATPPPPVEGAAADIPPPAAAPALDDEPTEAPSPDGDDGPHADTTAPPLAGPEVASPAVSANGHQPVESISEEEAPPPPGPGAADQPRRRFGRFRRGNRAPAPPDGVSPAPVPAPVHDVPLAGPAPVLDAPTPPPGELGPVPAALVSEPGEPPDVAPPAPAPDDEEDEDDEDESPAPRRRRLGLFRRGPKSQKEDEPDEDDDEEWEDDDEWEDDEDEGQGGGGKWKVAAFVAAFLALGLFGTSVFTFVAWHNAETEAANIKSEMSTLALEYSIQPVDPPKDPATGQAPFVAGRLFVGSDARDSVLLLYSLPRSDDGTTYQLWGKREDGTVFAWYNFAGRGDSATTIRIRAIPRGAKELFLTVEPARDSAAADPVTPTMPIWAASGPVVTPP